MDARRGGGGPDGRLALPPVAPPRAARARLRAPRGGRRRGGQVPRVLAGGDGARRGHRRRAGHGLLGRAGALVALLHGAGGAGADRRRGAGARTGTRSSSTRLKKFEDADGRHRRRRGQGAGGRHDGPGARWPRRDRRSRLPRAPSGAVAAANAAAAAATQAKERSARRRRARRLRRGGRPAGKPTARTGRPARNGRDGADGVSPTAKVEQTEAGRCGDGHRRRGHHHRHARARPPRETRATTGRRATRGTPSSTPTSRPSSWRRSGGPKGDKMTLDDLTEGGDRIPARREGGQGRPVHLRGLHTRAARGAARSPGCAGGPQAHRASPARRSPMRTSPRSSWRRCRGLRASRGLPEPTAATVPQGRMAPTA